MWRRNSMARVDGAWDRGKRRPAGRGCAKAAAARYRDSIVAPEALSFSPLMTAPVYSETEGRYASAKGSPFSALGRRTLRNRAFPL